MGMKSPKQDGGECRRKWHRTRKEHLLRISGEFRQDLCERELELTVCCRYAQWMLHNPRVHRYLIKNHASELHSLQNWLSEFERMIEM
jgi:hypothetical protein